MHRIARHRIGLAGASSLLAFVLLCASVGAQESPVAADHTGHETHATGEGSPETGAVASAPEGPACCKKDSAAGSEGESGEGMACCKEHAAGGHDPAAAEDPARAMGEVGRILIEEMAIALERVRERIGERVGDRPFSRRFAEAEASLDEEIARARERIEGLRERVERRAAEARKRAPEEAERLREELDRALRDGFERLDRMAEDGRRGLDELAGAASGEASARREELRRRVREGVEEVERGLREAFGSPEPPAASSPSEGPLADRLARMREDALHRMDDLAIQFMKTPEGEKMMRRALDMAREQAERADRSLREMKRQSEEMRRVLEDFGSRIVELEKKVTAPAPGAPAP